MGQPQREYSIVLLIPASITVERDQPYAVEQFGLFVDGIRLWHVSHHVFDASRGRGFLMTMTHMAMAASQCGLFLIALTDQQTQ